MVILFESDGNVPKCISFVNVRSAARPQDLSRVASESEVSYTEYDGLSDWRRPEGMRSSQALPVRTEGKRDIDQCRCWSYTFDLDSVSGELHSSAFH